MDCISIISIFNMNNWKLKGTKELVQVHKEGWQKRPEIPRIMALWSPQRSPQQSPNRQDKLLQGDSQFLLVSASGCAKWLEFLPPVVFLLDLMLLNTPTSPLNCVTQGANVWLES